MARCAPVLATVLVAVSGTCGPQAAAAPTPVVTSPSVPAAPAPGMDRYVDPVNGWSISYPTGWQVDGSDPAFVQIRDPGNQALVGVHVVTTDRPLNAAVDQVLASDAQDQAEKGLTWVLSSRQLIVLPNGTSAVAVRGDLQPGGRSQQLYVLRGGKLYAVNAETYLPFWDSFSADFERILLSFTPPG